MSLTSEECEYFKKNPHLNPYDFFSLFTPDSEEHKRAKDECKTKFDIDVQHARLAFPFAKTVLSFDEYKNKFHEVINTLKVSLRIKLDRLNLRNKEEVAYVVYLIHHNENGYTIPKFKGIDVMNIASDLNIKIENYPKVKKWVKYLDEANDRDIYTMSHILTMYSKRKINIDECNSYFHNSEIDPRTKEPLLRNIDKEYLGSVCKHVMRMHMSDVDTYFEKFFDGLQITSIKKNKANIYVVKRLRYLYEKWKKGDIFAFVEANFFTDFYCTKLILASYTGDKPLSMEWRNDDRTLTSEVTKYKSWRDELYSTNLMSLLQLLNFMRNECRKELITRLKRINIDESEVFTESRVSNWNLLLATIPLKEVLQIIRNVLNEYQLYASSASGLYRFMKMENPNSKAHHSCNCACISFLLLVMLSLIGYPNELLFTNPQVRQYEFEKGRKDPSHWSIACTDPSKSIIEFQNDIAKYVSLEKVNMDTLKNFEIYILSIIDDSLLQSRQHNFQATTELLQDLKDRFNIEFSYKSLLDKNMRLK